MATAAEGKRVKPTTLERHGRTDFPLALLPRALRTCTLLALVMPFYPTLGAGETQPSNRQVTAIQIEGLQRSSPRIILRELPFSVGQTWQPGMAPVAERRIRNLGLFRAIQVSPPNTQGKVLIHLKERWSLWVVPKINRNDDGTSALGINTDEFNLWGLGHHIRLAVTQDTGKNFSGSNGTSYTLGYQWPRISDTHTGLSLGYTQGNTLWVGFDAAGQSVANYLVQTQQQSIQLNYSLGPVPAEGWDIRAGLSRSRQSFQLTDGTALPDISDNRNTNILAGISYTQIDDHITWLTGETFSYGVIQGLKLLGSTHNTLKNTMSWRQHRVLTGENTLNLRLNGGLIMGNSQRNERFDLGNRNHIRGYFPGELQATRYLYGTLEGRFPSHPGSNFVYVAFTDIGHISDRGQNALGKPIIAGLGGGIRWTLRWLVHGTLRLDMAYGLASRTIRIYLGTGQAF